MIGLPLLSMLCVRAVDVPLLAEKYGWEFQTKHQLGVKLMKWFMTAIRELGVTAPVWLAVDGAYAAAPEANDETGRDSGQSSAQGCVPVRSSAGTQVQKTRASSIVWLKQNFIGETIGSQTRLGYDDL